ncbi:MAG: LysR substrate-binding domain-containing protein [Litorivicinus sp.]
MSEFISRGRVQGISLKAVRAFVESARLGSFKASAEWLNVTPSAISHQVKALEEYLGVELFKRGIREIQLTPHGARFAEKAMEGLRTIDMATTEMMALTRRTSVRVAVAPFLATRWLMTRMSAFEALHPGVELEVIATTQLGNPSDPEIDLMIRLGTQPSDTTHFELLFEEALFPVASASMAARVGGDLGQLHNLPLLDVATRPGEWEHFLMVATGDARRAPAHIVFQSNSPAIEAAVEGIGVALADPLLVRNELQSDRLVTLGDEPVAGENAYWLVYSDHAVANRRVQSFVQWLHKSIAEEPYLQSRNDTSAS